MAPPGPAPEPAGQATVAFILLFLVPPPISLAAGALWPVALLFGVVWIVAVVNAYNFMDGIDGLAGGDIIALCAALHDG